ncbi:uncharacterized protein B0I36DRAFT_381542 [Microdochium trichocladiopsis]|uniref:T6SS Phospholipase effector Tle1-like catalytic domain-containing protein n=1 Tax=Microdochium trichocladiopsis TaxID=1682393 RepID=A0A9P9BSD4_9PEZI|nr:uncharacterized protein B0I36DRAFT_381542 [Microdochium trichocladiopsis]KAH7034650.1 hypothetical protein B0I36DRAFT_381542 [Microdochium trichocladiopsis]
MTFSQGGFQPDPRFPAPHPKRIVVCCDGTWQSSVSGIKSVPSNITRIARSIARTGLDTDHAQNNKVWDQVVYYDAGLGTGVFSIAEKIKQGDLGMGFVGNVIEAYNFIALNYSPGDQIFCFGFSRGAYTARAVAGLVTDIGVLSPRDMQDFPELFALYQANTDSHGFRKSKEYREWVTGVLADEQPPRAPPGAYQEPPRYKTPPHRQAPEASRVVEVVGVFDTVGSLGVPDTQSDVLDFGLQGISKLFGVPKVGFHNVSLSPYIKHAFQALALDEHRGPFTPTLWHVPPAPAKDSDEPPRSKKTLDQLREESRAALASGNEDDIDRTWEAMIDYEMEMHLEELDSDLLQVWFPGVHVNIGGGSTDMLKDKKGDFEQLSTITLAWMIEQASPYLQFNPNLAQTIVEDRMTLITPILKTLAHTRAEEAAAHESHWAITKAFEYIASSTHLYKPSHSHSATEHADMQAQAATLAAAAYRASNGWATGPIVDSFTGVMKIAGSVTRTPGRYNKKDSAGNDIGVTNEQIHPSVKYRFDKRDEWSPALKGFQRRETTVQVPGGADGQTRTEKRFEWYNADGVRIPEYVIKAEDVFTRYVANLDDTTDEKKQQGVPGSVIAAPGDGAASRFLGGIDRVLGLKTRESELV